MQVRKTPELFDALLEIRDRAMRHGFRDLATIAPSDWIFHTSVAYCATLDPQTWTRVTEFVGTLRTPRAESVIGEVGIVAFDDHREYSCGVVPLRGD